MPAEINSAPPAVHLANQPVWWQVGSGVNRAATGKITLVVTGNCANDDTLRIRSQAIHCTFTAKAAPDPDNPFEWPVSGPSVILYTDSIEDILRKNSQITRHFNVIRSATNTVVLEKKVAEPFWVFISHSLSGITATGTPVTSVWAQENLSCVLEVWQPAAIPVQMAVFQATYRPQDAAVDIDISSAFADLRPSLPATSSITYSPAGVGAFFGEAPECWTRYYILFADSYGNPAIPRTLQETQPAIAIRGSLAGDSLWQQTLPLRHTYRDRFFTPFRKPVVCDQPDWVYVFTGEIDPDTPFFISALVTFDDGSEMSVAATDFDTLQPNTMYWFVSGFSQLGLESLTIPPGATRIVEYTWRLFPADIAGEPQLGAQVLYSVEPRTDQNFFLLFDNGVGGCESVNLRGKIAEKYTAKTEEYARPRTPAWTPKQGDFGIFSAEGRKEWEVNTGLYDRTDPYLEHLLQLSLAQCWLIDTFGQRFLAVRVESREMVFSASDDNLASISFTVRALWRDSDYNV